MTETMNPYERIRATFRSNSSMMYDHAIDALKYAASTYDQNETKTFLDQHLLAIVELVTERSSGSQVRLKEQISDSPVLLRN